MQHDKLLKRSLLYVFKLLEQLTMLFLSAIVFSLIQRHDEIHTLKIHRAKVQPSSLLGLSQWPVLMVTSPHLLAVTDKCPKAPDTCISCTRSDSPSALESYFCSSMWPGSSRCLRPMTLHTVKAVTWEVLEGHILVTIGSHNFWEFMHRPPGKEHPPCLRDPQVQVALSTLVPRRWHLQSPLSAEHEENL